MNMIGFIGVVEDINDPLKQNRVRVRAFQTHSPLIVEVAVDKLPWARTLNHGAAVSGVGTSALGYKQGSWVMGFFLDGENRQQPIVVGAFHGRPEDFSAKGSPNGFQDPDGIFPKYINESDVSRLSRNENTLDSKVQDRINERKMNIPSLSGGFSEPEYVHETIYPNNVVYESENGILIEVDDTKGKERVHIRHPSGTYTELSKDGSYMVKIKTNKYILVAGDDYTHVEGDSNVTISGNSNVLVQGDSNLQVDGDATIDCKKKTFIQSNEMEANVAGNLKVTAQSADISAVDTVTITANKIDLNP